MPLKNRRRGFRPFSIGTDHSSDRRFYPMAPASLSAPATQTLKTTIKDPNGQEYQLNLKYDKQ